jgi:trans-2,3-dihydro-3-hydroxyanthranilate isomerase
VQSIRLPYAVLDVFTDRPLAGNQLAVIMDADGLAQETMQALAAETKLSETTFVQTATEAGADYRNRIFTVVEEVPFAGHPSLGTAVAVAIARGETHAEYTQQTGAGLQPVRVAGEAGRWHASVLQEPARFGETVDAGAAMAAVGLDAADAHPDLPPRVVTTGLDTLIVLLAGPEPLGRARPDFAAIDALLGPHGAHNFYLAHHDPGSATARARMFTRLVEEGEDPATGSAAGPLLAHLAESTGAARVEITQGVEMGRPSRLEAEFEDGRVRAGGGVVPVVAGYVLLPAEAG